jgi:transcriptional regulator NrdR family protein
VNRRPKGTPRPRLCRECHAPATHVEVEERPAAVLKRDGTMRRFTETVNVFWCAQHSGMKALA